MSPKIISFAIGIGFGAIVYLAIAWVVTRLLSLHDRVHVQDSDDSERGSSGSDMPDTHGHGVLL